MEKLVLPLQSWPYTHGVWCCRLLSSTAASKLKYLYNSIIDAIVVDFFCFHTGGWAGTLLHKLARHTASPPLRPIIKYVNLEMYVSQDFFLINYINLKKKISRKKILRFLGVTSQIFFVRLISRFSQDFRFSRFTFLPKLP